jgi:hypothetical protein
MSYWRGGNWTANHWDANNWLGPNAASSSDVSVALTGLRATTAYGALAPAIEKALDGQVATTAQGALIPEQGTVVALTGLAAITAAGVVVPLASLQGQAAETRFGQLVPELLVELTGLVVGALPGLLSGESLADGALSGQGVTAQAGVLGVELSIPLVGGRVQTGQGVLRIPYESYDNGVWTVTLPVELFARRDNAGETLFFQSVPASVVVGSAALQALFADEPTDLWAKEPPRELWVVEQNVGWWVVAAGVDLVRTAAIDDLFVVTDADEPVAREQSEELLAA